MTHVFALTLREIAERKLIFLAAALVGVITLLVPFTPIPGSYRYGEVVDTAAFVFALLLMAGGGVILGATTIGRDLSSGRIAFFFTRELRAAEIWFGRIAGMFLTLVLAATVVLLPATLIGGGLRHTWSGRGYAELPNAVIFAILLPLAAHYVSVALRSRSAWLALDVVALCAAIAALWTLSLPFAAYWAGSPRFLLWVFVLLTLFLAFAGWIGLAKGRISPAAVHRWSAITLWSFVALFLLGFSAWRSWVFSVSPDDLSWKNAWAVEIDGNGEWIAMGTGPRGRGGIPHEFLMSTRSGAWLRIDEHDAVAVSADRRTAVIATRSWSWHPPEWISTTMQIVDLTQPKPKPRDLGISFNKLIWLSPALSANGSRMAVLDNRTVSVYSLPSEKLIAAIPYASKQWSTASFVDDDTVQIHVGGEFARTVYRFDLRSRKFVSKVTLPGANVRFASGGATVAVPVADDSRRVGSILLFSATSGERLGEIPFTTSWLGRRVSWLADGGIAVVQQNAAVAHVAIHGRDGAERRRTDIAGAKWISIVGEQRAGELIIAWTDKGDPLDRCSGVQKVGAIDVATGALRVLPIEGWPRAFSYSQTPPVGSASTRLFTTCDGKVVMFDAASGETRTLLGGM